MALNLAKENLRSCKRQCLCRAHAALLPWMIRTQVPVTCCCHLSPLARRLLPSKKENKDIEHWPWTPIRQGLNRIAYTEGFVA